MSSTQNKPKPTAVCEGPKCGARYVRVRPHQRFCSSRCRWTDWQVRQGDAEAGDDADRRRRDRREKSAAPKSRRRAS